MNNSNYKSVPVIASVIGGKSRKSMYLTSITSLDGKRIYRDAWVPTSWNTTTNTQWQYNGKNVYISKYYKFDQPYSVLLTASGAVDIHGRILEIPNLVPVKTQQRVTIAWEFESQSLHEFPISRTSDAMLIEKWSLNDISLIKSRLIDNRVVDFVQITERHIIYVPTWVFRNFNEIYVKHEPIDELMTNDDSPITIIENTSIDSIQMSLFPDTNSDVYGHQEL